jgi:hypothetical protein
MNSVKVSMEVMEVIDISKTMPVSWNIDTKIEDTAFVSS